MHTNKLTVYLYFAQFTNLMLFTLIENIKHITILNTSLKNKS